jgi:hypothetical protein
MMSADLHPWGDGTFPQTGSGLMREALGEPAIRLPVVRG